MKKTIKINLSGLIFHLDEDAYQKLKTYLDKIHKHFELKESGKEIISDIESRIAELFQYKINKKKQVITIDDVDEVIGQLGDAEDFDEMEEKTVKEGRTKKLYRDPENAILGGVSAGIGAYFNIDAVWIRLLFVLLLFGYGIIALIYVLLWLIIPKAETYAQKLEMRGEEISISEIENRVRKEYDDVKSNLKEFQKTNQYQNFKKGLNEIFTFIGNLIKAIFNFITGIIGTALIIALVGVSLYAAGVIFFDIPGYWFWFEEGKIMLFKALNTIFDPEVSIIILSTAVLACIIPILGLIYLLFRIFGYKGNDKIVYPTGVILWVISIMVLAGTSIYQIREFSSNVTNQKVESLDLKNSQTLKLSINKRPKPDYLTEDFMWDENNYEHIGVDEEGTIYIPPVIKIIQGDSKNYQLEIKRISRGKSSEQAIENTKNINYHWELTNSSLMLDPYFIISKENKFRMQRIILSIKVPEGKQVCIPEETEQYLTEAKNSENYELYEMGDHCWKMQEGALTLAEE